MLDEMIDLDEERLEVIDVLIKQNERVARAYNKKVKVNKISIEDYI